MASPKTLKIQHEEPRKYRVLLFGNPKPEDTERQDAKFKGRRKKKTKGAFGS